MTQEHQNPLASILDDAVSRYEALANENAALRQDNTRLRDEFLRRDADDALRGARCACSRDFGYRKRFHVALFAATFFFCLWVGWWK